MKSLLQASSICTAATLLFCLPAAAADLMIQEPAPIDVAAASELTWDAYAGIMLAYVNGDVSGEDLDPTLKSYLEQGKADGLTDGLAAGLYAGINFDASSYLLGIESDLNAINSDNDAWYGTLRMRAGPSFGDTSLYATAGIAFGQVDALSPFENVDVPLSVGYTVGVGVEQKLSENVSWKAEYLYLNLGDASSITPDGENPSIVDWTAQTIRTGIAFHF